MHQHAIARLIALRKTVKESASACAEDVVQQINEIMFTLLKQEVFMDFISPATDENLCLPKLLALMKNTEDMSDEPMRGLLREELHCIMSACLSSSLLGSSHAPLPCNGLSADQKLQHVRSSLTLSL
jgi:hypothetical protein